MLVQLDPTFVIDMNYVIALKHVNDKLHVVMKDQSRYEVPMTLANFAVMVSNLTRNGFIFTEGETNGEPAV